jgi:AcrR family transcriptional regulator
MRTRSGNKEKAIIDAAIIEFARNGFEKTRVAGIAERAGIATGSVYSYFTNKEEILHAVGSSVWRTMHDRLKDVMANQDAGPAEKFDMMIDSFFNILIADPQLALVYVNEYDRLVSGPGTSVPDEVTRFLSIAETIISDGIRQKVFSAAVNIDIFREYLTGGFRHVLSFWARRSDSLPLTQVRDNVIHLCRNGLLIHPVSGSTHSL